jgi:hypothetical protein
MVDASPVDAQSAAPADAEADAARPATAVEAGAAALDAGQRGDASNGPPGTPGDAGGAPEAGSAADAGSAAEASTAPDAAALRCGTDTFCADFEDQTGSTLTGTWKATAPNCSGDGKATLVDDVVHAGKRALRIQSGGGVCNHIFATPTIDLARYRSSLWVRFYVRFDSAITDDHVTFLALADAISQKDLRMGGQKKIYMWNRERDDATLPELSPNGVSMSSVPKLRAWQCIEFHLGGSAGSLETYVDGAKVPGLEIDQVGTHDIDGQWLRSGPWTSDVRDLRFGWESYGSQPMTLWFDDIAVAGERTGC